MKKTFLFSAIFLMMAAGMRAQSADSERLLRVTHRTGHTYDVALEPGLSIHLNTETTTSGNNTSTWQWVAVENAQGEEIFNLVGAAVLTYIGVFPDPPTGVEQVKEGGEPVLRLQADGISVQGCADKTPVSVWSVDGKQLFRTTVQGGTCFVPRSSMPRGVVIIKVNNKAIKMINR